MKALVMAIALALAACGSPRETAVEVAMESEPTIEPVSEPIMAQGPEGVLAGTRLSPGVAATDAVVLILPGSGATDRNGRNAGTVAEPYRLLAEGLAERGVASVRVDKRGMFGSAGDANAVTLAAYREDVESWIDVLDTDCVVLAGHSEGSLVATRAADLDGVCGVVSLAGPGRSLDRILEQQLRANPANGVILDAALAAIASLRRGERVEVDDPRLAPLFRPEVQGYLIDLFAFDPAAAMAGVDVPVLIVGGGRDMQVSQADYSALVAARPDAQTLWVETMGHVLVDAEPGMMGAMAAFGDAERPLSDGVADAVAEFAIRVSGAGSSRR